MKATWRRLLLTGLVCGLCAAGAQTAPALAAPGGSGSAVLGKDPDGSIPPAGSDDWSCLPTRAHPRPVVLVHGTWGNQNDWDVLAPRLKAEGYCAFSLNYGRDASSVLGALPGMYATGDIPTSADELAAFVDRVRAAPRAGRVGPGGDSQGARGYREFVGLGGGGGQMG
ncbi:esterase/lipase family protein, partial [Nocardia brasiliensis]|uniref:esterase/lipase family protein n=1 Tax=Nocardia brasiliensis TaxID=37326 RepID=UPI003D7BFAF9